MSADVKPFELRELWRQYKTDGDQRARERLVVAYSPLVKFIADRMAARLPSHVDKSELVSSGLYGLIGAIDRFEVGRGIKFESFASRRVKGAIIDELRQLDWVPRGVRERARDVEKATAALQAKLQRAPTEEETATKLGIGVEELRARLSEIADSRLLALDDAGAPGADDDGGLGSRLDTIEDPRAVDPQMEMESSEVKDRLAEAIERLPGRERLIVALYYYDNLNLREISEVLGVTESRASQLHTKAMLSLRSRLEEPDSEAAGVGSPD